MKPSHPRRPTRRIAPSVAAADHPTGHELIAIDAWLPGSTPTDAAIELTTGPSYGTRFWRCRACGIERSNPDEFDEICSGLTIEAPRTDGGTALDDTELEHSSEFVAKFLDFGPAYAVETPTDERFIVDIDDEFCSGPECPDDGGHCVHLRRVKGAITTGELPGPDGRFLG